MCLRLLNTARRGRSAVPSTLRRIRWRIRPLDSTLCFARSMFPVLFAEVDYPALSSQLLGVRCQPSFAARSSLELRAASFELLSCCLACLAANHFVAVLDALALVGIGLAERADLGRGLPHFLLVDSGDGDVTGLGVDDDVDAFRNDEPHRMRVAELEDHVLPLHLGAVTDADDVELALEAFADALDVVRHERAHEAMEGAGLPFLVTAGEGDDVVLDLHTDSGDDGRPERALRALHHDGAAFVACFHALG